VFDGVVAIAAHLGSYWLRFPSDRLEAFLPGAWTTLPFVVVGQLIALSLAGVYVSRPGVEWFFRVAVAAVTGTMVGAGLAIAVRGLEGLSRGAFLADAVFVTLGAIAWRGLWLIVVQFRGRSARLLPGTDLVDRAADKPSVVTMLSSLYSYRQLLRNLVLKDLKLKYRGSVFGFLWSLANPLLMIVVYTIAFTYILRVRTEGFVFFLMLGQLSWSFFAGSAAMSTGAIIDNAGLLRSVYFPRAILPIATVLFNLAQFLLTMAIFLPAMLLWFGVPLSASMLAFPAFLVMHTMFVIGTALILSTWTAFFRDVRHLLEVALAMMFWTTPILYELRQVPENLQLLVLLSPMSSFVVAYQNMFVFRELPEPRVWLVSAAYAIGALVIGATLVLAFEDRFTEQL
jgi:ABC-2 type transport system permease protein